MRWFKFANKKKADNKKVNQKLKQGSKELK